MIAHATPTRLTALDLADLWEMMDAARARLDAAKTAARTAKREEFEALRVFEERRQAYQLAQQRAARAGDAA